jgi:membrane protein required for colicin V production
MYMNLWSFLDFVFVGIVLISTIVALMKGLAREIISLVALVGGFILAVLYYPIPGLAMADLTSSESVANLIGFLIIFLGCILIGAIAAYLFNRFIKAASLELIDRLLGGIYGLLRGWIVSSIIVLALIAFPIREGLITHSFLAPYLLAGARTAVLLVPQDLKDKFYAQYQKVLEDWNKNKGAA